MEAGAQNLLDMTHITKAFHGVKALDDVEFHLQGGTVHALMGENGAGKSTLMKILSGVYSLEQGTVLLKGESVKFDNPREAMDHGIAMIHQELSVVQEMTIAENIFLGNEPRSQRGLTVNKRLMNARAKELIERVGLHLPTTTKMKALSVAQAQMVEIAKAISKNADIIVMDEPTSAITEKEVDILFGVIEHLRVSGCGIIYITHKMDEVFRIADVVTVMRDGHYIATHPAGEITDRQLVKLMIDRELQEVYKKRDYHPQEIYLEVKGLASERLRFSDISFNVRKGEIVGFAGLVGAGRTEVAQSLFGVCPLDAGEVWYKGKKVHIRSPKQAIKLGMGYVTEERKQSGIVPGMSCCQNMSMVELSAISVGGWIINHKREESIVKGAVKRFDIRIPRGISQPIQELSGGNQQKVILAKWILPDLDFLILDEPTRGIDIGAKVEIYHLITEMADAGKTIILISSEMQEILNICDRIVVFHEGRISGELTKAEASQEKIMSLAVNM